MFTYFSHASIYNGAWKILRCKSDSKLTRSLQNESTNIAEKQVVLHFHAGTYSLWSDWHPKKNKSQIETGGKKEIQEKWNKCEFQVKWITKFNWRWWKRMMCKVCSKYEYSSQVPNFPLHPKKSNVKKQISEVNFILQILLVKT